MPKGQTERQAAWCATWHAVRHTIWDSVGMCQGMSTLNNSCVVSRIVQSFAV